MLHLLPLHDAQSQPLSMYVGSSSQPTLYDCAVLDGARSSSSSALARLAKEFAILARTVRSLASFEHLTIACDAQDHRRYKGLLKCETIRSVANLQNMPKRGVHHTLHRRPSPTTLVDCPPVQVYSGCYIYLFDAVAR